MEQSECIGKVVINFGSKSVLAKSLYSIHHAKKLNGLSASHQKVSSKGFVDNYLLARDAREVRNYYAKIQPDVDMSFKYTNQDGVEEVVEVAVGLDFFWPDADL